MEKSAKNEIKMLDNISLMTRNVAVCNNEDTQKVRGLTLLAKKEKTNTITNHIEKKIVLLSSTSIGTGIEVGTM